MSNCAPLQYRSNSEIRLTPINLDPSSISRLPSAASYAYIIVSRVCTQVVLQFHKFPFFATFHIHSFIYNNEMPYHMKWFPTRQSLQIVLVENACLVLCGGKISISTSGTALWATSVQGQVDHRRTENTDTIWPLLPIPSLFLWKIVWSAAQLKTGVRCLFYQRLKNALRVRIYSCTF